MSKHLSDVPDGTNHTQVANTCVPTGERPIKTPIFISEVRDNHAFLARLRASCLGGMTAHLKAEKLMVIPSKSNVSRVAISALRSLNGWEDVIFHTLTLP